MSKTTLDIDKLLQNWPGRIDPGQHTVVSFDKIDEPNGWLSNMSRHPLRVPREPGGILYPTAEHYFQCERYTDTAIRNEIRAVASPMSCKMKAKTFRKHQVITSRSPEDLDLMQKVLRLKLENHPALKEKLLALPAEAVIIEDASRRHGKSAGFWGMRLLGNIWAGQNWLGRLWMELRLELEKTPAHTTSN